MGTRTVFLANGIREGSLVKMALLAIYSGIEFGIGVTTVFVFFILLVFCELGNLGCWLNSIRSGMRIVGLVRRKRIRMTTSVLVEVILFIWKGSRLI